MRMARLHDRGDVQRLLNHAVDLRHDETVSSGIGRSSLGSGYHVADAGRFVLPVSVTRVLCANNTRWQTSVSIFKIYYRNVNFEWQIKKQVAISAHNRFSIWRERIIVKTNNKNDRHFPLRLARQHRRTLLCRYILLCTYWVKYWNSIDFFFYYIIIALLPLCPCHPRHFKSVSMSLD